MTDEPPKMILPKIIDLPPSDFDEVMMVYKSFAPKIITVADLKRIFGVDWIGDAKAELVLSVKRRKCHSSGKSIWLRYAYRTWVEGMDTECWYSVDEYIRLRLMK